MKIFFLNGDKIAVCESRSRASRFRQGAEAFESERELSKLAAKWPGSRFHEIWNALPGTQPVRKFTDRNTAVRRIWTKIQQLEPAPSPRTRRRSKTDQILDLLRQTSGATLKSIMKATGWQAHSVRGFISGYVLKKMGLRVKSSREDGERVYAIHRPLNTIGKSRKKA